MPRYCRSARGESWRHGKRRVSSSTARPCGCRRPHGKKRVSSGTARPARAAVSCVAVAMPDLHRVLAAAALAVGAGMPAQAPVPPPEALAAARTRSIDLLLEQMLAQDGG